MTNPLQTVPVTGPVLKYSATDTEGHNRKPSTVMQRNRDVYDRLSIFLTPSLRPRDPQRRYEKEHAPDTEQIKHIHQFHDPFFLHCVCNLKIVIPITVFVIGIVGNFILALIRG